MKIASINHCAGKASDDFLPTEESESVADRYVIDPTPQRFWPQLGPQTIPQARLTEPPFPMAKSVSLHLSFFVSKRSGDLIQAAGTVRFAEEVAVYATTSGLADKTRIIVPNGQS